MRRLRTLPTIRLFLREDGKVPIDQSVGLRALSHRTGLPSGLCPVPCPLTRIESFVFKNPLHFVAWLNWKSPAARI